MSAPTRLEISGGLARLTLDDGKVNAMSTGLLRAIAGAADEAERADAVLVVTGREGIFSAGFDLKTFAQGPGPGVEMVRTGAEVILRLLETPIPVLTVCTGHAYPMGAFLMLSADSRLGVAGPWRIGMNETAIGITVPRFALALARHRLTAPGYARIQSAAQFGPEEAMRLGYLDRVVEPDALAGAVDEEAARLRDLDRKAFAGTKARANLRAVADIRAALEEDVASAPAGG